MEFIKFSSPNQMSCFLAEKDLYNIYTKQYLFLYNDEGHIAHYELDTEEALELSKEAKSTGDYWGAFLGPGGRIDENPLSGCLSDFLQEGWVIADGNTFKSGCRYFKAERWIEDELVTEPFAIRDQDGEYYLDEEGCIITFPNADAAKMCADVKNREVCA